MKQLAEMQRQLSEAAQKARGGAAAKKVIAAFAALSCGHNSREMVTTPESGPGWTGVRREARCLDCGKDLKPWQD